MQHFEVYFESWSKNPEIMTNPEIFTYAIGNKDKNLIYFRKCHTSRRKGIQGVPGGPCYI